MKIAAVGSALPPHFYDQETLLGALRTNWAERHHNVDRLEALHRNVLVGGRHLALPLFHSAWLTATVLGMLNFLLIQIKAQAEDKALGRLHLSWDKP